jgi:hypothetical protein
MANFTTSPGVAISEIDNTYLTGQPVQSGAAIIGPTVKGTVETPTLVTSYSDFVAKFGDTFISGGQSYSYLTSIAAYNYFNYGGTSLLVTRVVSESAQWSSAQSTTIPNYYGATTSSFSLETISEGTIMNNSGSTALTTLGASGSLISGSVDNIRWEVTNSNTGSGTFNVLIRRGNDTENNKTILEAWNNLTLDPNSDRYISAVIGDQILNYNSTTNQMELSGSYPNMSQYIRVKSVTSPTPNYFDANGVAISAYTSSIPVNGSGSAGGSFYNAGGNVSNVINSYWNVLPNATWRKEFNKELNTSMVYRATIKRPGITELNPNIDYTDPFTIRFGNPFLKPALAHNFDWTINWLKGKYYINTSVGYNVVKQVINSFRTLAGGGKTFIIKEKR